MSRLYQEKPAFLPAPQELLGKIAKSVGQISERRRTFAALASATHIFQVEGERAGLEFPWSFHRTAQCKRNRVLPDVCMRKGDQGAYFQGVAVCGSVWSCPVCAAKIAEVRREEISRIISAAHCNGFKPCMITFTVPHYAFESCGDLLERFLSALKALRNHRSMKEIRKETGNIGLIRSLEIKLGNNGWHPHTHEVWVSKDLLTDDQKARILKAWRGVCSKRGFPVSESFDQHSIDFGSGQCDTSEYLTKQGNSRSWGVDREMTKGIKKSGGMHPFQLLVNYMLGMSPAERARSAKQFVEYSLAFKGKAQIYVTPQVRKLVTGQDLSDEEAAKEDRPEAENYGYLDHFSWGDIVKKGLRVTILEAIEAADDAKEFADWLSDYCGVDATESPLVFETDIRDPAPLCLAKYDPPDFI